jgi:hypothetical protein
MDVLELLTEKIKAEGGDGLMNARLECGCILDDLAPCGCVGHECVLARRGPGDGEYDFIMHEMPRDDLSCAGVEMMPTEDGNR